MKIVRLLTTAALCVAILLGIGECFLSYKHFGAKGGNLGAAPSRKAVQERLFERGRMKDSARFAMRRHRALVLGCSFTLGEGVDSEQTYVYKLNQLLPHCTFDNAGLIGCGAYPMLLALDELLEQNRYDIVIYAAISNQVLREPSLRYRTVSATQYDAQYASQATSQSNQNFTSKSKQSFDDNSTKKADARTNEEEALTIFPIQPADDEHKYVGYYWDDLELPGDRYLRTVNFARHILLYGWTFLRAPFINQMTQQERAYQNIKYAYLLRSMHTLATAHNSRFAAVGLYGFNSKSGDPNDYASNFPPLQTYAKMALWPGDTAVSYPVADVSYPEDILSKSELHTVAGEWHGEHDMGDHPSPLVHTYYAEKIADFIQREKLLP